MQIPKKTWDKYIKQLSSLNYAAGALIENYVEQNGIENKKALTDYAFEVVQKYGNGSAALSAAMYDALAAIEGADIAPAIMAETPDYGEVAKTVYGTLKTSQNPSELAGATSRLVKRMGADTTLKNAKRDHAQFAWVPAGDTCAFCLTLASNGWQYMSKEAMKGGHAEHIHANCDCTYAVRFDNETTVAGYDPQKYKDMYDDAEGKKPEDKINSIRRMQYQDNKGKINAQKRQAYTLKNGNVASAAIKPATNRQEAYNILNTMFGDISSNAKSIDEQLLVENINRLNELNAKYNAISADNIGYFTASPSGKAMAWTSTNYENKTQRTNLSLVNKWYKDANVLVATEQRGRNVFFQMPFEDSYTKTYTITHEYGHILEANISKKRTDWNALDEKIAKMISPSHSQIRQVYINEEKAQANQIYNEIIDIAKKNNPSFDLSANLSKYGHTDKLEFFAEVFANSQCGAPNELGNAMNEWLKKEGF